ncbi:conserved hypothetical protein [Xanthomonas phaseoli pv. phaseoli]|uniref:Secreted protein n=1 Tax=Xanthomonas campestris pv. phaseoli TaxID=317013 RepID=A0AB38E2H3_XANCH|nr:conserved hypothetical protein [Xanthomonas phaseoli pv. phaseoli]SON85430.1 conserved hypothetical protein [Xanthomonas phaseoli pv. phaseoli]SON90060.1 conserved hypothetical protein [Xanthomonas phaseoli pv. phaseoli]SOO27990.1 conserved hypothetical protein [Xanthomonas phaseoli pv. phaseoli]
MGNVCVPSSGNLTQTNNAVRLCLALCIATLCGCGNAGQPSSPAASIPTETGHAGVIPSPATPAHTTSAPQLPSPGHYATERGWGQLTIAPEAQDTASFSLETLNADASCSFNGKLRGTQAAVYDGDRPGACTLEIAKTGAGAAIRGASGSENACREYCGGNGSFEGDYLPLAATCEPTAMQRTRKAFQSLYDQKDYVKAETTLAPLYRSCLATSSFSDEGAIRNDYAITQHRLGDDARCLEALAPYRDDARRSDEAITDGMSPAIVDDYLGVIHAARTNLKLCGDGAAG